MTISFKQVPSGLRIPGTYFEVDPSKANTAPQILKGLVVGQMTNGGSRCSRVATSAGTLSGVAVLTFASAAAVQNVQPGQVVIDRTATAALPAGVTVLSKSGATVTLSGNATGAVGSGDFIEFYDLAPLWLTSQSNAKALFGEGSQLARMDAARRLNDPFGEWWAQPLPDDPASIAATGTITFAGAATAAGVLALYVAGVAAPVVVANAMTAAQVATAVAAAINASANLPVTAAPSAGIVTVTAKNAGLAGNNIDLRLNYYGPGSGEATPAGVVVAITAMAGGATNPSAQLIASLATLPPFRWSRIASAYGADAPCLNALQSFMNDVAGQWAWLSMKFGLVCAAQVNTLGTLQTNGLARNDQHTAIIGAYNLPSPPEELAAALAGATLAALRADPGTSLNGVALLGLRPPAVQDRFHPSDQDTLLHSGISTFTVARDGTMRVQKLITTYQVNSFGDPDNSYLYAETLDRIAYALSDLKTDLDTTFAGYRLADDGTRFGANLNIATPAIIAAHIAARYDRLVTLGICQDADAFRAGLDVERDLTNRNRVNVLWPGVMVDDLDIIAGVAQFTT